MGQKKRKLSKDRQAKLDRTHKRDCPGWRNIEFSCLECRQIRDREARA